MIFPNISKEFALIKCNICSCQGHFQSDKQHYFVLHDILPEKDFQHIRELLLNKEYLFIYNTEKKVCLVYYIYKKQVDNIKNTNNIKNKQNKKIKKLRIKKEYRATTYYCYSYVAIIWPTNEYKDQNIFNKDKK